jgi:uncharacterized protein (TIGR02391 family)
VTIDHFSLRDSLRKSILGRVGKSEAEFDPSEIGWAAYAVLQEDRGTAGVAGGLLAILEREKARWTGGAIQGRELVAIAALSLLEQEHPPKGARAEDILIRMASGAQTRGKLSALRLPDQLFMVSLAIKDADQSTRQCLVDLIRTQLGGPTHRQVFLHAALKELGQPLGSPPNETEDVADAVATLWWQVRYTDGADVVAKWERLDALLLEVDIGATHDGRDHGVRSLGPWEKALLFESLCREIRAINPKTLFELYPLHPRLKKIVRPHFDKALYPSAVAQAVQVLNELIQQKTGDTSRGENELVTHWMACKPPRFALNDNVADPAGADEHYGLTRIIGGVFKGLRNPLGHRPEDAPLLARTPYETIDQLALISYLMKRVERGKVGAA